MCFSASGSFGASAVLAVISIATVKQIQHKSQIVFACIPIFFSLQQFTEGLVWLSFASPFNATMNLYGTYIFLLFSQIVWPLWIPIAMIMVENKGRRRKIQRLFVVIGLTEAIFQTYCLFTYPVHSQIIGHHIYYQLDYHMSAAIKYTESAFYIAATIISPFFTSIKRMWIVGLAILISCVITVLFYKHYTVSVWCFFASIISISIYLIMREIKIPYQHIKQ
ncbi:MAG: DUF6629 family protein [Bacteroidia bacterium]